MLLREQTDMAMRISIVLLALAVVAAGMEYGPVAVGSGSYGVAGPAEARVGRPLTPVSVAGVGRRTVRRCAVGVYDC
jgi:hypothetical protein